MSIELDETQLNAIRELRNGSILIGGTGVGKSRTAVAYYYLKACGGGLKINGQGSVSEMKRPMDLYIITTAKKRDDLDWEKECAPFALSTARSSSYNNVQVTVDSWNNISNYEDYTDAFFIFDEQRAVGSGKWSNSFIKIAKRNRWILLSATPGDTWLDYIPVFVANGYYKNRTEFIKRHVVYSRFSKYPKVDRYVEEGVLLKHRNRLLVDMPFERHTTRHIRNVKVDHDTELFEKVFKKRWHIYEDRPLKDAGEMFSVMRRLVNSDPSRIATAYKLLEQHPRLIIFYNFNYELERLRTLAQEFDIPVAEWNGHKHEQVPTGDKWIYLVQYTAGAEGWNCITTDAMVFYSLNYSYKINEQAKGRIDRRNTPYENLFYYIFQSDSMIDKAISKSLKHKKSFNEKDYARSWE